jgi:hypothetical protein
MSTESPPGPTGPSTRSSGGSRFVIAAVILSLVMVGVGIGVGALIWSGGSSSSSVSAASNGVPSGNPTGTQGKESSPNLKDYQTAATMTWNVPSGTRISFSPAGFNCALNPYGGSFTTTSSSFSNVINPFVADTSFGNGCLFKFSTGLWGVSFTGPGISTSTTMSIFQVGPRTYSASCNGGGIGCVGVPRPLTGTLNIIVSR